METRTYTQVIIQPSTATLIEVHRSKRSKVWRYDTNKLTRNQLMRFYRVLSLQVWEQFVEFSYDMSPIVTLDSNKPVLSRKNARLVEVMKKDLTGE